MIASTIATPMRVLCAAVIAAGFLLATSPASAAGLPKAKKLENVVYYKVFYIAFKPDKVDEGRRIIHDHFLPAGRKAGNSTKVIDFLTGPWDSAVYYPLKDGPAALSWITPPRSAAFWAALAEQEGGVEKARALVARYMAAMARTRTELAYRHIEPDDDK